MSRWTLCILMTAALCSGCGQKPLEPFQSAPGRFSVMLPGKPKERSTSEPGVNGGTITYYIYELQDRKHAYALSYGDLTGLGSSTPEEAKMRLGVIKDAMQMGMHATASREQTIAINGYPGLEFEFTASVPGVKEPAKGTARIYLVGERLYRLIVIGKEKDMSTDGPGQFLNSFKLEGTAPAPPPTQVAALSPPSSKSGLAKAPSRSPNSPGPGAGRGGASQAPRSIPARPAPAADDDEPGEGFAAADPSPAPRRSTPAPRRPINRTQRKQDEPAPPVAEGVSLLEGTRDVIDVDVSDLYLPAKDILPCMVWSNDADAFFVLDKSGYLRRISFDSSFTLEKELNLENRAGWLSMSAEGLVVTLTELQEVWVVDPRSFEVKQKIAVAGVRRAASTKAVSLAYAVSGAQRDTGNRMLDVLDLKSGKRLAHYEARQMGNTVGFDFPIVTPTGKHLLCLGAREQIIKFALKGKDVKPASESQWVSGGNDKGLVMSPDGAYVALTCGAGNNRNLKNHPKSNTYTTFVYKISGSLQTPSIVIPSGAYPETLGFDLKAGFVLAQNADYDLMLFRANGTPHKNYKISRPRETPRIVTRQFLVHPDGWRVVLLCAESIKAVEIPRSQTGFEARGSSKSKSTKPSR